MEGKWSQLSTDLDLHPRNLLPFGLLEFSSHLQWGWG